MANVADWTVNSTALLMATAPAAVPAITDALGVVCSFGAVYSPGWIVNGLSGRRAYLVSGPEIVLSTTL